MKNNSKKKRDKVINAYFSDRLVQFLFMCTLPIGKGSSPFDDIIIELDLPWKYGDVIM